MSKSNFFSRSISAKLITLFLAVSIIPLIVIGVLSNNSARNALEKGAFNQLLSVGTIKGDQIVTYFDQKFRDLEIITKSQNTIVAFNMLKKYHDNGGATASSPFITASSKYEKIYSEINPFFKTYLNAYGFYDIFFICADHGHIMYTGTKEEDLGTNLSTGKYRNSSLAQLWANVVRDKKPSMVDFAYYAPSKGQAAFVGSPVFDNEGNVIAVVALQLNSNEINTIMQETTGLGVSGESYLVGDDFFMKSDSRFVSESNINKRKVESESVKLALQHQSGTLIIKDYRDISVLSYYENLEFKKEFGVDFDWVMVTEIDESEAFESVKTLRNLIIILGFIIAIIVAIVAFLFAKYFTKPILKLTEFARIFATGDLSQNIEIKQADEIGMLAESFGLVQSSLRKQMDQIGEGVNVLAASTAEIMSSVSQLASSAAETATSVSETTSTVEEVKQTAEVSNQKANEVSQSAQKTSAISIDGSRSIMETIEGMNKIKTQMESIANIVVRLSEQSQTIGEIATSVSDLAEQSNLLAVNASIEAAKAGEQGKGFAVVAQEIKNLAERSKESTTQIRSILHDIQKAIGSAVMATEQGGKVVDLGLELTSTASEVITTLAASVEQASQATIQISSSSQQQLIGMDQITSAMENIKEASNQTAETTKQSEESVSDLQRLSEKLQDIIGQYKLR